MKKIIIKNIYERSFVNPYLYKTVLNTLIGELSSKKCYDMLYYINKNFNITKNDIITGIEKALKISYISDNIIIYLDANFYIKKDIKLITIIDFINYGNLSKKGTYFINTAINYIYDNINNLYKYFLIKGNSILWQ